MPKSFWVVGPGTSSTGTAAVGTNDFQVGNSTTRMTVSNLNYSRKMRTQGRLARLYKKIFSSTTTGETAVVFFNNLITGNQIIKFAPGQINFSHDFIGYNDVVITDEVRYEMTSVIPADTYNYSHLGGIFEVSGTNYTTLISNLISYTAQSNFTLYHGFINLGVNGNTVESEVSWKFKQATTLRNMQAIIYANVRENTTTIKVKKNGVDGNQSIVIPAGFTGLIEDTTNTDSYAENDTGCFQVSCGLISSDQTITVLLNIDSDSTRGTYFSSITSNWNITANTIRYMTPAVAGTSAWTQSQTQILIPMACEIYNPKIFVSSNTATYSTTFVLQIGGQDSNIILTVGAGVTGWIEESSKTLTIQRGQQLNWKIISETGSGQVIVKMSGFDYEERPEPPSSQNLLVINVT